jgi:SAM-dependent methyltransferase
MKLDPVFAHLDEVTPRQGRILDLGCGYGMGAHWLALTGKERDLLGVDYDADKIRVARQSARNRCRVQFEQADLLDYEFPTGDAVLFIDVLHYWSADKQLALLKKARAALRPGGRLILRDAARATDQAHRRVEWWERLVTRLGHNKTVEGLHFQTRAELQAMLQTAGFRDITEQPAAGNDSNILLLATA